MIRSKLGFIACGVATLIVGLIILFPARVAVHWFAPANVTIGGIQGTVWTGSAKEASVSGFYTRDIRWSLRPLRIFTGELAIEVSATPVSGFFEAVVSLGFGGAVSLSELSAALPLELFSDVAGIQGLSGSASLRFDRLVIVDGLAIAADGTVVIADLTIPILSRDSLGGYEAEFSTQNDGIAATVTDTDGIVDLQGDLQVKSDRSYVFIAQVAAKAETPPAIRQQLQFLPPADEPGQQELRLDGIL